MARGGGSGEENAVRELVDTSERAVHAREEEPAEEEFLAEHCVEDPEDDDEGEPAPGAFQVAGNGARAAIGSTRSCECQRSLDLAPAGPKGSMSREFLRRAREDSNLRPAD
jgi:hypothetical protein